MLKRLLAHLHPTPAPTPPKEPGEALAEHLLRRTEAGQIQWRTGAVECFYRAKDGPATVELTFNGRNYARLTVTLERPDPTPLIPSYETAIYDRLDVAVLLGQAVRRQVGQTVEERVLAGGGQ